MRRAVFREDLKCILSISFIKKYKFKNQSRCKEKILDTYLLIVYDNTGEKRWMNY